MRAVSRVDTLEGAQAIAVAVIEALVKFKRDAVVADHSPAEMSAWSMKPAEALTFSVSQDAADALALVIEAQVRGIPLSELVDKVLAKAGVLSQLEAGIARPARQEAGCGAIVQPVAAVADQVEDIDANWPI